MHAAVNTGAMCSFQFTHPGGVRPYRTGLPCEKDWVSIHAPGRGATLGMYSFSVWYLFQFTHPGGVRRLGIDLMAHIELFQFTHPGGVRRAPPQPPWHLEGVSIHAPGRGATLTHPTSTSSRPGFNSRTREGCDISQAVAVHPSPSFNSRTREGCDRVHQLTAMNRAKVSIHAPGRGATVDCLILGQKSPFQFTHPGGVRPTGAIRLVYVYLVSIHAPGRGATYLDRHSHRVCRRFNSRTREGCDPYYNVEVYSDLPFQFTHPGGVRLFRSCGPRGSSLFQFTHPGGVRLVSLLVSLLNNVVSIHAPGRGATVADIRGGVSVDTFQFTHPGGVRPNRPRPSVGRTRCFNSRTREGCDGKATSQRVLVKVSIHAPGRGATSQRAKTKGRG